MMSNSKLFQIQNCIGEHVLLLFLCIKIDLSDAQMYQSVQQAYRSIGRYGRVGGENETSVMDSFDRALQYRIKKGVDWSLHDDTLNYILASLPFYRTLLKGGW